MKNRKWLALGLATCMTLSVLSACGQSETKKEESSESKKESSSVQESKSEETSEEVVEDTGITFPLEETMTFTGFTNIPAGGHRIMETTAWQDFEKYGNITVEWSDAPAAEAAEKAQLLLAGGDYPDFIYRLVPDTQAYGVEEGIYIPLEDLIRENMPNLTALLDELNGWKDLQSTDGHIYSIGMILSSATPDWPIWVNQKWLDRVGMEMPTNMEELYEVSKAFKEQDANGNGDPNDEIPVTFSTANYIVNTSLYYLDDGIMSKGDFCVINDGEKSFYPFTDGFKENYLRWWKRMWDEELMDHNSFTQTTDQMRAVSKAGDAIGWFVAHNPLGVVGDTTKMDYYVMEPKDYENPLSVITRVLGGGLAITDKCENPEVLLAWFDYFYSVDGGYMGYYGREGVHYTRNENGSVTLLREDLSDGSLNSGASAVWLEPASVSIFAEDDDSYNAHYMPQRSNLAENYGIVLPSVKYTEEESETISMYQPDLFSYINTYAAEVITGVKDLDATWDEFQSTMKAMGAEELEAVYKAAFARASE